MSKRYPEIKKYILKKIDNKEYVEGVMLPTEKEFTTIFSVSRMTVRRALDELIHDGVLVRKRGSGVFLANKKIERSLSRISVSHDENIKQMFSELSVKVIDFKIVKDHYIAKKFLNLPDEEVYQIKRLQLGNNKPIVYENIFLPVKFFDGLTKKACQQSMSDIVAKHINLPLGCKKNEIIVEARVATKKDSALLQIPVNSPILQINVIIISDDGEKLYCGINSYPGDSYNYRT